MRLKDLEFDVSPGVKAMRWCARRFKPDQLQLEDMDYVHDTLEGRRPERTGQTFAEFYSCQTTQGPVHLVVKPGRLYSNFFPRMNYPLTESNVWSGLGEMRSSKNSETLRAYKALSDDVLIHFPFEQYTREKLADLFIRGIGMGSVHAPVVPIASHHSNFHLSGSLVMGAGDGIPIDRLIDGHDDERWWQVDRNALKIFAPLLKEHKELWSLICAMLICRAVIGDSNLNPGAFVATRDFKSQHAFYSCDAGKAWDYLGKRRPLSDALNEARIIEKCAHVDFVREGSPERADMEIILEVVENFYRLTPKKIRAFVMAAKASVPHFVIGGELREVDDVCAKFEESRRELAGIFNPWAMQMNKICGLPLFTSIPEMPTAKSGPISQQAASEDSATPQPTCERPPPKRRSRPPKVAPANGG